MTKPLVPTEDLLDAIVGDIRTGQWIDDLVEDVMACITEKGWRIVRTQVTDWRACRRDDGSLRVHPKSELHMRGCRSLFLVTDEWAP